MDITQHFSVVHVLKSRLLKPYKQRLTYIGKFLVNFFLQYGGRITAWGWGSLTDALVLNWLCFCFKNPPKNVKYMLFSMLWKWEWEKKRNLAKMHQSFRPTGQISWWSCLRVFLSAVFCCLLVLFLATERFLPGWAASPGVWWAWGWGWGWGWGWVAAGGISWNWLTAKLGRLWALKTIENTEAQMRY